MITDGMVLFAGKTVWSMPERFECTTLAKKRYINTLPFPLLWQYRAMHYSASRGKNWPLILNC